MKQGGGGSKLWGREGERSQSNSLSPLSWRVRKGPPKLGNQFEFKGQEFQHTNSKFCIHWQVQCGHPFSVNWWYSWIFFFFFFAREFLLLFLFWFWWKSREEVQSSPRNRRENMMWKQKHTEKTSVSSRVTREFLLCRLQSTASLGLGAQTHLRSQGAGREFAMLIASLHFSRHLILALLLGTSR